MSSAVYVYEVTSDVPLTLVNGVGNTPVLTPSSVYSRRIDREGYEIAAGPQGEPSVVHARLLSEEIVNA